jgi:urea transport system permease protein
VHEHAAPYKNEPINRDSYFQTFQFLNHIPRAKLGKPHRRAVLETPDKGTRMSELFIVEQLFNGLSIGSILLLAALGLGLSFGLMRVINMAHGEMLMVAGYITYLSSQWVKGGAFIWLAIPLAFIGTAILGAILEATVIRRLYGRPLDTLLATWGISLILQQAGRNIFGPTGVPVNAPEWLSGAITVTGGPLDGLVIPHTRLFVLALSAAVLIGMGLLLTRTRFGMYVRAVNQNREVAQSLGVNTRLVDMGVFALGSGIAGIAGAGLALLSPVNPTVGQSYIVNAFLVVIVGGIGSVAGTAISAVVLGFFTAATESLTSVSLAKVIVLVLVVAFLQIRPRGFVSVRSRALEEGT